MERTPWGQVARWAGSTVSGPDADVLIGPDVVTDSRKVTPGSLFVALAGERVDGHDFVAAVAASGAGAALVTRRVEADIPQLVVDDPVAGLAGIARGVVLRARAAGLVTIGLTGSAGKTSTKDLLAQVLEADGPTIAPVGSFNNEIGAPLTATQVDASTRYLVSEMGARGRGHIAALCDVIPPTVGVVINVGTAHVGEFGSQDAIAVAKGELVEALDADGWAVLNADDPRVAAMADRTPARIAAFSMVGDPGERYALRVWASDVVADELQRHAFTLHAAGEISGAVGVRLQVMGERNVANALAAAAAALCVGLTPRAVAAALSNAVTRSRWRMQLDQRADGLAVLNDAYNANPESMAAALRAVVGLRRPGGRVIGVLGDMLELGADAAARHEEIGRLASDLGVDELVAIGGHASDMARGFAGSGRPARYCSAKDDATQHLITLVQPRDVVLVKASRGIGLETVADALLKEGIDA